MDLFSRTPDSLNSLFFAVFTVLKRVSCCAATPFCAAIIPDPAKQSLPSATQSGY